MAALLRACFWAALVYAVCAQNADTDDGLDKLISELYPPPPGTNVNTNTGPIDLTPTTNTGSNAQGDCECVPYYLCKNSTIIKDGLGIIDIRMKEGPCANYFEICCGTGNRLEKPEKPDPVKPTEPVKERPEGCGYRNPEGVGFRITGAVDGEAAFAEFPWMVAILREEEVEGNPMKLNVYQCGGTLVHPRAVLTAAHCVTGKAQGKKFKVRAGEWDTQTTNEIIPHQDADVEKIISHQHFRSGTLYNDVALLILKEPLKIAENVDVVCLPSAKEVITSNECFASGWGKDVFGKEGKYQVILKKVQLPMVPNDKCQELLRKTRLGRHFELHTSFVCAGGEPGKDTCKGDGGSPLVCPVPGAKGRYMQAGIVAWGIGCGEDGTPGVYASVAEMRAWIDEQMEYERLDKTYKY